MSGAYQHVIVERRGEVLWLSINRPAARNALSRATLSELGAVCTAFANEPSLKAAVLTGSGEQSFAAGGDVKEFARFRSAEQARELFDLASVALDAVRNFPVPVVAALNGWALGGGCELAMACDFRVAAPHARVGYVHARLNITSGFGGGADLMRRLGPSRALRHALAGKVLSAREALELGMVDAVAAEGESLEHAVEIFLQFLLPQRPQVIRGYKAMAIAERQGLPLSERRAIERDAFARTWSHPDHWAALDATSQKQSTRSE